MMVEELDALTLAARGSFTDVKNARPLIEEQTQIQSAWVQYQPGVTVEMLIGEGPYLLVNGMVIAANAFGFAHGFQRAKDIADLTVQAPGIVADAGKGQFSFTDVH